MQDSNALGCREGTHIDCGVLSRCPINYMPPKTNKLN